MFNRDFLYRKIKLIQEGLGKLELLAKLSFDSLIKDYVAYGAAERYLERIITRAIDINRHLIAELAKGSESVRTYEDTFLRLADIGVITEKFAKDIAPSAGLRNILVHEYDEVNEKLIYKLVKQALDQYSKYCNYVLKFMAKK